MRRGLGLRRHVILVMLRMAEFMICCKPINNDRDDLQHGI
jgi:hypothetical protein